MKKALFLNPNYVEECAEAVMEVCHTFHTGVATPMSNVIKLLNEFTPLRLKTSKLILEHHIVNEDGTSIIYRKGVATKKTKPLYKFRPKCDRSTARIFALEVLKDKYKRSQENYEKYIKNKIKDEEVDIDELNETLDELLEESVESKETTEESLKDFVERQPAHFTFFNHYDITLEEAIRVVKSHGGTVTF